MGQSVPFNKLKVIISDQIKLFILPDCFCILNVHRCLGRAFESEKIGQRTERVYEGYVSQLSGQF
jgi:hypothetical protein